MKTAVRYYSRSGNTKVLAEAIARAAGTEAISVDQAGSELEEPVDVLFIGGALYAYGLDKHLKEYLKGIKNGCAKKAVVFSTSLISKHSIDLIKKGLAGKGIEVEEDSFYARSRPDAEKLKEAERFVGKFI